MSDLKENFESLFKVIGEEFPSLYDEIVLLAGKKKARLTNGEEFIIFYIKRKKIQIAYDNTEHLPTGKFTKESIINLLDGQLTLNDVVKNGIIDCKGKKSEILLFFRMLRILLYASSRSIRAYEIWKNMKCGLLTNSTNRDNLV